MRIKERPLQIEKNVMNRDFNTNFHSTPSVSGYRKKKKIRLVFLLYLSLGNISV